MTAFKCSSTYILFLDTHSPIILYENSYNGFTNLISHAVNIIITYWLHNMCLYILDSTDMLLNYWVNVCYKIFKKIIIAIRTSFIQRKLKLKIITRLLLDHRHLLEITRRAYCYYIRWNLLQQ